MSDKAGITYQVGSVISIAVVPHMGIGAAILISTVFNVIIWVIKPTDDTTWKKSWSQLAFNTGMHIIAIVGAGLLLLLMRNWLGDLVAEPEWEGDSSVNFFVRDEGRGRLEHVECYPASKKELEGPLKDNLDEIGGKIRKAKPQSSTEETY